MKESRRKFIKNSSVLSFGGILGAGMPLEAIAKMSKIMNFEKHINNANILITGEGNLDFQTLQGKAPFEVAKKGKKKGLLTIALVEHHL